jgi:uncharacterized membrane protein YcaP (DUF421 family)
MDMLIPDIAIIEKVARSLVVSVFPLVAFRVAGKPHGNLDREHPSVAELRAALRKEGIATMSEVRYAVLEEDGRVSVIPRSVLPA